MTAGEALRTLRFMLSVQGCADADEYRTHDFRRGHAEARAATRPGSRVAAALPQDIRSEGGSLADILKAGEWRRMRQRGLAHGRRAAAQRTRPPAFFRYLDLESLDAEAAAAAHVAATSDDDSD